MADLLSLHGRLTARLDLIRKDLDEVLVRLDDSLLPWAPTEGMRTVAGQLIEIAGTERQIVAWMRDGKRLTFQEAEAFDGDTTTLAGMKAILAAVRTQTLDYLASLSEEELETPAPFPPGWWDALCQPMMQRSEVFRSIAQHEWYHTGQLVSYLWSRGDNPYRW
ncbi:MAG TPA: DinB family protein [Fimbriimonadaceae bacterium]|nr:DinB family protein [Fimbriimonadaceae bacterium]